MILLNEIGEVGEQAGRGPKSKSTAFEVNSEGGGGCLRNKYAHDAGRNVSGTRDTDNLVVGAREATPTRLEPSDLRAITPRCG